jgi:hypothetical protein
MTELYRYDRVCPKCGGNAMRTEYEPASDSMKRTCPVCGYWMYEYPLDHDAPPPARRGGNR